MTPLEHLWVIPRSWTLHLYKYDERKIIKKDTKKIQKINPFTFFMTDREECKNRQMNSFPKNYISINGAVMDVTAEETMFQKANLQP